MNTLCFLNYSIWDGALQMFTLFCPIMFAFNDVIIYVAVWPKQDDEIMTFKATLKKTLKIHMWNILVKVWKMIFPLQMGDFQVPS